MKCDICGRDVDSAQMFDLGAKAACEPSVYGDKCSIAAIKKGWRLDGGLDRIDGGWVALESGPSVDFFRDVVKGAERVLEWGSGYSTCDYPKHADALALWLTVEHWRYWVMRVQAEGTRDKVAVLWAADPTNYIGAGDGIAWDIEIVDGMWRRECVANAYLTLAPGGIVIANDANPGFESFWAGLPYDFSMWEHEGNLKFPHVEAELCDYRVLAHEPLTDVKAAEVLQRHGLEILR